MCVLVIVHHRLLLDALLRRRQVQMNESAAIRRGGQRCNLQGVERLARIPIGHLGQMPQRLLLRLNLQKPQSALAVSQCPLQHLVQLLLRQRPQLENLRPRHQRRVDEEKRIMGRRPNQPHHAPLHVRQEHVLLRLVEPMDLINEQNRGLPGVFEPVRRAGKHPPHLRDVRFHATEPFKFALGLPRDNLR